LLASLEEYQDYNYLALTASEASDSEPRTYDQAVGSNQSAEWRQSIQRETDSLRENDTSEYTDPPSTQQVLGGRYVFQG
jgi:hypothetical protein